MEGIQKQQVPLCWEKLGKCLVIGGGGFLGSWIVRQLLERGVEVRILGRHAYPHLEVLGAECYRGDITDFDQVLKACAGIGTVFHTASLSNMWGQRQLLYHVNIDGTANVLRACKEQRVPRLVYTSSPSVVIGSENIIGGTEGLPYPPHYTADYPKSKSIAEQMVLQANAPLTDNSKTSLRVCAIRPHLLWGPEDPHILCRIRQVAEAGRLVQVGSGKNLVTITQVQNAAWAHLLSAVNLATAGNCAGKAYFIGDAEPVCLWPWLNRLMEIWHLPPIQRRVPWIVARGLAWFSEKIHAMIPCLGEPRLTGFIVDQMTRSHAFSHEAAARDFGYAPIISPEEGLQQLIQAEALAVRRESTNIIPANNK